MSSSSEPRHDRVSGVDESDEQLDLPRLLTVPEVAELLRLSAKGVYSLVEARRIPFVRVSNRVRFIAADLVGFIEKNRVDGV